MIAIIARHKISTFIIAVVVLTLCLLGFSHATAKAQLAFNPWPGPHVPQNLIDHLYWCNTAGSSPGFIQWNTDASGNPTNTITVPYGYNGGPVMRYYSGGAVCQPNSAVNQTQFRVVSLSSSTGSASIASGGTNALIFWPYVGAVGYYQDAYTGISFTPSAPMTTSQTVTITLSTRVINHFTNNAYGCVPGPGGNQGGWNFGACQNHVLTFSLRINVAPPTPTVSCARSGSGTIYTGQSVSFTGSSSNASGNYTWSGGPVGASSVSGTNNSIYTTSWASTGTKTITVTRSGRSGTCTVAIAVQPQPPPTVSCVRNGSETIYAGQNVSFTGSSANASGNYTWSASPAAASSSVSGTSNSTYTAQWSSAGTKTITVTRSGVSGTCTLQIELPPTVFTCTTSTIPVIPGAQAGGPHEPNEEFTLRITINNTSAQFALPMTQATHPITVSVSPSGINGLDGGTSATYNYTANPGQTVQVNDTGVSGSAPNTYAFAISIGGNPCPVDVLVGNKSYLKIYGSDVWVGGGFEPAPCDAAANNGHIYTFAREVSPGQYIGSSAQLTVTALLTINEFYSVSTKTPAPPAPPKGLTFANNTAANTYGGNFGGSRCITNYWEDTADDELRGVGPFSGSFAPGLHQYVNDSALTIGAPLTVPLGSQVAIFVDGDVQINANIERAGGATNTSQLPYLAIIARGDIKIASGVTRIDALLVAQQRDTDSGGVIHTCTATDGGTFNSTTLYGSCSGSQLIVNGAMVAQRVDYHRVFGTLSGGQPGELAGSSQAAEIVNYTPDFYLAPTPLRRPGDNNNSTGVSRYDAISTMPPVY